MSPNAPEQVQVVYTKGHLTAGEVPACPQRIEMDPNVPLPVDAATAAYLLSLPDVAQLPAEAAPEPVPDPDPDPVPAAPQSIQPVQPFSITSLAPPAEPSPLSEV